ncbi:MAG TPA: RNA polymerase sigma-G factor [Firmicutes bacterium]|jgi:RNA polymerase sporulation-specific sigma factor|nr:RNA polymerase sigma-G factor [Bacillota bacterium]HBR33987.1 RNA polymerase sigma-G factor [Bacillota bacterium]
MTTVNETPGEANLLSHQETLLLIKQVAAGNQEAKAVLIERNLRLVKSIVGRFSGRGVEYDDLVQIGALGLMKAIERFNPDREVQFSTYAVPMIIGEIKQYLRTDGGIKVSRGVKEVAQKVMQARNTYLAEQGKEPTLAELAEVTACSREEIATALEVSKPISSLQEIVYEDEGSALTLEEKVGTEMEEQLVEEFSLRQALQQLEPRLRGIIEERFFGERTQLELATKLGVSQVQISRLEKAALCRLRELLHEPT